MPDVSRVALCRSMSQNARDSRGRREARVERRMNRAGVSMRSARIAFCGALLLLLVAITRADSMRCSRLIDGVTKPRSISEGKYHFFITLYNQTEPVNEYMPNTRYSVVLRADNTDLLVPRKFTRFLISAEAKNETANAGETGMFDLQDDMMTKFTDICANTVVETSKVHKDKVSVTWTSPSEGSGCILLRATVLETSDTWYMDDPELVLTMCQDSKAEADDQGSVLQECCACEEAKYEVTFEGLWSRNTHPKDFPSKGWLIRFSDVIGASHTREYRFWNYNGTASIGLKQVAELGTTRKLESELKAQSEHIRTIIKARGISYPNVTGKTFAVFRVDRKHHLMSLVSMIDPSPDWIVGVSGLELCLPNRSWIEHKELNLYPYDVGTDDGITYLSADSPSVPQKPIQRITSTNPNDSRSPFYDPSGLDMKPLAKLYLNRQRLYEKSCDVSDDKVDTEYMRHTRRRDALAETCKVTSWGEWTMCSVTCGRGTQLRQRHFIDEATSASKCSNTSLTDRRYCYNTQSPSCPGSGRYDSILESDKCQLSSWSQWSSCSSTCGDGSKTRSRNFRHKNFRKQCKLVPNGPPLQQTISCENEQCESEDEEVSEEASLYEQQDTDYVADMSGRMTEEWLQKCPADRYTEWAMWSPCSSSCGPGVKVRSRLLKGSKWINSGKDDIGDTYEECKVQQASCMAELPTCDFSKDEAKKICSEPMETGNCKGKVIRSYFDRQKGSCHLFDYSGCNGNRNNFPTEQDCYSVCGNFQRELKANLSAIMKNFKVSLSSILSYHIPAQEQRSTKAKRAQYGEENFKGFQPSSQIMELSEDNRVVVDCQVSEWSEWSRCENCRGYTVSTRNVTVAAKDGGKSCPRKLFRKKKCHKTQQCLNLAAPQADGMSRRYLRDKNTGNDHISVDCRVTKWSTWSKCSATCGEALRTRVRSVMVQPRGPWAKLCPPLAEFRKCRTTDCPQ